jgi:hypothetical protein
LLENRLNKKKKKAEKPCKPFKLDSATSTAVLRKIENMFLIKKRKGIK